MKKDKTQRFVEETAKKQGEMNQQRKLSPIYVLTGIVVLILSLIPLFGALIFVLWGVQIIQTSLIMAIILMVVGVALLITLFIGTIIFAIYYFTNDAERKLREIKYKDVVKFEDIFIKCEKCGATLLINTEVCPKCGYKLENDEENEKINKLNEYFLDNYNFEISEKNVDIINSYVNSNLKTFEYSFDKVKSESIKSDCKDHKPQESVLNKFLFNFKNIIVTCSIVMVCLIIAFLIFGKYVFGF